MNARSSRANPLELFAFCLCRIGAWRLASRVREALGGVTGAVNQSRFVRNLRVDAAGFGALEVAAGVVAATGECSR